MRVRPSKDIYYLEIAKAVSRRSPCIRARYGAIIVKNDAIVSTGYNGPVRGGVNCYEIGCLKDILNLPHGSAYDYCPAVHAEENCVSGDTLIVSGDGSIERADEINTSLLTFNLNTFDTEMADAIKIVNIKREMLRIILRGGVELTVSPNHILYRMGREDYLEEVYAKEINVGDRLPHVIRLNVDGKPHTLPKPLYPYYKLRNNVNWSTILSLFRSKGYTWRKISKECGFSISILSNLKNGNMIRRKNMLSLLKLFPQLNEYIIGIDPKNVKIPNRTNEDICQIIGYFICGGGLSKNHVVLYSTNRDVLERYKGLFKQVFNVEGVIRRGRKDTNYTLHILSSRVYSFFTLLDIGTRKNRNIPKILQRTDNKSIIGLIRGLFDAGATLNNKGIYFSSPYKQLINTLRILLLRIGIFTSIYKTGTAGNNLGKNNFYSLKINGDDLLKYYKLVGFTHPYKEQKLRKLVGNGKLEYSNIRSYPAMWFKNLGLSSKAPSILRRREPFVTYIQARKLIDMAKAKYGRIDRIKMLEKIINNFIFLDVIKIERIKEENVMFDFYVPPNHNFIANGILIHNCVLNAVRVGSDVLGGTLYIYGEDGKTGRPRRGIPCDRCKRAIINAGISTVVMMKEDGSIEKINVKDWIKEDTEKYIRMVREAKRGHL